MDNGELNGGSPWVKVCRRLTATTTSASDHHQRGLQPFFFFHSVLSAILLLFALTSLGRNYLVLVPTLRLWRRVALLKAAKH